MTEKSSSFEIEAGTMERFLELLKSREDERVPAEEETLIRRAVFVAPLTQLRTESGGIPVSIRRVRAAFAYGADQITLSRLVYDGFELPHPRVRATSTSPARTKRSRRLGTRSRRAPASGALPSPWWSPG